jgi:hypothetical protein
MKKLRLLFLFFGQTTMAQSGLYDSAKIGYDASANTLSGVFKEVEIGKKQKNCVFYFISTIEHGEKTFPLTIYDLNYQLIGFSKVSYAVAADSYHISLDKNLYQCQQMMPDIVGTGIDVYSKNYMPWKFVKLVKSPRAYFHKEPNKTSKGKSYVVKGDDVGLLERKGEWYKVQYVTATKKVVEGWVKKSDMTED